MSAIGAFLLGVAGKLVDVITARLNRPAPPAPFSKTFDHQGVTNAQLDALIDKAKDLPSQ